MTNKREIYTPTSEVRRLKHMSKFFIGEQKMLGNLYALIKKIYLLTDVNASPE